MALNNRNAVNRFTSYVDRSDDRTHSLIHELDCFYSRIGIPFEDYLYMKQCLLIASMTFNLMRGSFLYFSPEPSVKEVDQDE